MQHGTSRATRRVACGMARGVQHNTWHPPWHVACNGARHMGSGVQVERQRRQAGRPGRHRPTRAPSSAVALPRHSFPSGLVFCVTRLGSPRPHLCLDWAHACRICAWTELAPAIAAPGLSSPAGVLRHCCCIILQHGLGCVSTRLGSVATRPGLPRPGLRCNRASRSSRGSAGASAS